MSVRVRDRGNLTLTDRSSGLVRPSTHVEALLRVVSWVTIPDGVGVDRGLQRGFFLTSLLLLLHSHRYPSR